MFESGKGFTVMAGLLMMILGFSSLALAQEGEEIDLVEFVGNLSYDTSNLSPRRVHPRSVEYLAQGFVTGPRKGGYELFSAEMYFRDWRNVVPDSGGIQASLHSVGNDPEYPGEKLADFTSPQHLEVKLTDWSNRITPPSEFTIPEEYTLSPNTKYFIVVTGWDYKYIFTDSPNEDDTKADGWVIDNRHAVVGLDGEARHPQSRSGALKMKLSGKAYDDGTLRTADTASGNLEIFNDADGDNIGSWKFICDDGWGIQESAVACRQQGLSGGYKRHTPSASEFANRYESDQLRELIASASDAFLLDDVDCEGTESRVIDCDHGGRGVHDCAIWEAVGVLCSEEPPPPA